MLIYLQKPLHQYYTSLFYNPYKYRIHYFLYRNVAEDDYKKNIGGHDYLTNSLAFYDTDAEHDLFFANAPGLNSQFTINRANINGDYIPKAVDINNSIVNLIRGFSQIDLGNNIAQAWNGSEFFFTSSNSNIHSLINSQFTFNDYQELRKIAKDYGSFEINNNNGKKYFFKTFDVNTIIPETPRFSDLDEMGFYVGDITHIKFVYDNYSIKKNTWLLDQIEDLATKRKIYFNYYSNTSNFFLENITKNYGDLTNTSNYIDNKDYNKIFYFKHNL